MHAMSALFHIPQADPPVLEGTNWSEKFTDFLTHCLNKDPDKRWSAKKLSDHPFVKSVESNCTAIVSELVSGSKEKVKEIDLADLMENLADIDRKIETERTETGEQSARLLSEKEAQKKAIQEAKQQGAKNAKARETLRPRHLLVRETQEAPKQERDLVRNQMKELRNSKAKQQKAEKSLLKQQSADLESMRKQHIKDFESFVKAQEAELEKLRKESREIVENLQKQFQVEKKKLVEKLKDEEKKAGKEHKEKIKVEMKQMESRQKDELSSAAKDAQKDLKKLQKEQLCQHQLEREQHYQQQITEYNESKINQLTADQKAKLEAVVKEQTQKEKDLCHNQASGRIQLKLDQQTAEHDLLLAQLDQQHQLSEEHQAWQHKIEWNQLLHIHEKQEADLLKEQVNKQKYHRHALKKNEDEIRKKYQRTLSGPLPPGSPASGRNSGALEVPGIATMFNSSIGGGGSFIGSISSGGGTISRSHSQGHSHSGDFDFEDGKLTRKFTKKEKEGFETFRSSFIDEETQKLERFQKMQIQKVKDECAREQNDVARYHAERKAMLKSAHAAERQRTKEKQDAYFVLLQNKLEHEWNSSVA